ncbi:hypothetical protein BDV59DRAFT_128035 [Aspergillus ambiguus]|uniref:uncharacterized protein n=1 Tax=Aspergillus ambiguus TaxID=176160 RepID=UPI003CCD89B5
MSMEWRWRSPRIALRPFVLTNGLKRTTDVENTTGTFLNRNILRASPLHIEPLFETLQTLILSSSTSKATSTAHPRPPSNAAMSPKAPAGQITTVSAPSAGAYPTAGWWVCCGCRSPVNPVLSGDQCSVCSHVRCYNCTDASTVSLY